MQLGCAVGAVLAVAALVDLAQLGPASTDGPGAAVLGQVVVAALLSCLGPVLAAVVLLRRARQGPDEGPVWRWFAAAAVVVAVGGVADSGRLVALAAGALPSGTPVDAAFGVCSVAACVLLYQGLLHWNRSRGQTAEPGDWLNGLGALLCVVAACLLMVHASGAPLARWPWWELQVWLFRLAAAVLFLATIPTVAALAGLGRDVRVWMIGAATTLVVVVTAVALVPPAAAVGSGVPTVPEGLAARATWCVLVAVVAVAALVRPTPQRPRPATAQASTMGSLGVLAGAVTLLVLARGVEAGASALPTAYALLGVLVAGARGMHLVRDLSQLAQTRQDALTDELTGVANRRALTARLGRALDGERGVGLLLLDLDRFKEVNDRHGHAAGDELLRSTAARLREVLPSDALLARLGGDEFAVLLTSWSVGRAASVGRDLVQAAGARLDVGGHVVQVGASVGVATTGVAAADARGVDELMRRADVAMYTAKASGGGVSSYDGALDAAAREGKLLLEELRAVTGGVAVDGTPAAGELVVHYQPQVGVDGRVRGAEALVRWAHPRRGLLAPDQFLPLAEAHGLMPGLTRQVLSRAVADAAAWRSRGHRLRMAVNLSTSCLGQPDLVGSVRAALAHVGLDASCLVLEVTETTLMGDPDAALAVMQELVAGGVEVSIDDYGTGYSSLAYLNDLPATELKLDRAFTRRVLEDPRTAAIVAGTVELAHRLGLRLVAEGVEDAQTLCALRDLGCDETQGYWHSRPVPAEAFVAWLERPTPPRPRAAPAARPPAAVAATRAGAPRRA